MVPRRAGTRSRRGRGGYSPAAFGRDYARMANALPRLPLAGPASGQPVWSAYAPNLISAEPRLGLVTLHRYATRGCFTAPTSPQYHTIQNLLTPFATQGLAATVSPYAHLPVPLRVDELGSVNCGGTRGVSDTFASSLWALDTLFQLARDRRQRRQLPHLRRRSLRAVHVPARRRRLARVSQARLLRDADVRPGRSSGVAAARGLGPRRPGARCVRRPAGPTGSSARCWSTTDPSSGRSRSACPRQGTATVQRLEAPTLQATTGGHDRRAELRRADGHRATHRNQAREHGEARGRHLPGHRPGRERSPGHCSLALDAERPRQPELPHDPGVARTGSSPEIRVALAASAR